MLDEKTPVYTQLNYIKSLGTHRWYGFYHRIYFIDIARHYTFLFLYFCFYFAGKDEWLKALDFYNYEDMHCLSSVWEMAVQQMNIYPFLIGRYNETIFTSNVADGSQRPQHYEITVTAYVYCKHFRWSIQNIVGNYIIC